MKIIYDQRVKWRTIHLYSVCGLKSRGIEADFLSVSLVRKSLHLIFFISNLAFCLELGLLNSKTEIGTGVA